MNIYSYVIFILTHEAKGVKRFDIIMLNYFNFDGAGIQRII